MLLLSIILVMAVVAWVSGLTMALASRAEAKRLRVLNSTLEDRVQARTVELTQALAASEEQGRALASANQAKSDFLAAMSHELRTPLNAVMGFSHILQMNAETEPLTLRQSQAVEQILAAGAHLLTLIEEVLDLARIEAGKLSLSIERVDPLLVARQVCDSLQPEARAAGVSLISPAPQAGLGAVADRTRLRQVLLNLMSNAIKYNLPGGSVQLEARHQDGGLILSVIDTGCGLPADRMAELFQPFSRLGRETSATPGTGVGLAVSRRLAEAMGGRLEAESVEGQGSTFSLWLPASTETTALPAAPSAGAARPGDLPEATMLYVEDNPANVVLMRHVMRALGPVRLFTAETGPEGLTLARDLRPDVILLDINLPGMDGFTLKKGLDADPLTRGIPVLALSANAMPDDVRRGRQAGFIAYLTKPLDIPALAEALGRALNASAPASGRAA
jgi:hypothetical protein